MKWLLYSFMWVVSDGVTSSLVLANPSMLPHHPGYPMDDAKDPITGMALANDPGQTSLSPEQGIQKASTYHDGNIVNPTTGYESLESMGSGLLPKTKGYPDYKIEPPVTEATHPKQ